nr:sentrin-specific protease 5 isoform X1 [Pogona vitticeps]XP_020666216.1 sentrin-specific protease 5 isoform X1 [Pogona vitticeps]XP_020666217.1 sentrin-specific protease 5 isoform X1 [Pogona vitticeps]XP_020666218.1 sentrin-specific protease 5 isoform X1 [Pogona vitticeps]
MREHRRSLQRRRRLLAGFRKWAVGFWGLRQYCFQRKRLSLHKRRQQSAGTYASLKRTKPCRRKALQPQRDCVPERSLKVTPLALVENHAFPQKRLKNASSRRQNGRLLTKAEEHRRKTCQNELLNEHGNLGFSNPCQSRLYCTEASVSTLPLKVSGLAQNLGESNNAESHEIVILNNSRKKCCCRGLNKHGTRGRLTTRGRPKFKQCTLKSRSLFMMYKKLSMIKFRLRIAKSRPKFWRGKTCRLSKSKLSWVEKVTRDRQEDRHRGAFTRGSRTLVPSWKRKTHSPWAVLSLSDMNNHMPGPLIEKSQARRTVPCLTQDALFPSRELCNEDLASRDQNGTGETRTPELCVGVSSGAEAVHKEETRGTPTLDGCSDEVFISVMEKEISSSGSEESNQAMGADEVVLEPTRVDLSSSDSVANGPVLAELVQNEDSRSQMEVEGPVSMDVFGAELLDHPYCKSPLDEPLRGSTGQKSGTPKSGKRSSHRASCVSDEQLAAWLCGFLDEVMKKYGSLVPLCEKDVMGRLKEVFNEDFSHRKPFITKEIMKYQTRHPKTSTCNFRVFYNKHMLDMDDLTTLDGQNWLNDQIINMYGELIMDAVPDKVHFFNSFFHRQLVTKGYNGVKRWTKKVDLFKKTLLLIPIHLEVHWSLITVNLPNRIISFYDSQGIHFKFCVENIRKYLLTEAREKNHPDFLQGWQTAVTKCIPQQKNDSDCGVFVLQYCKCLALDQPFQFSQEDMPRVRKRIYKELCECRLMD